MIERNSSGSVSREELLTRALEACANAVVVTDRKGIVLWVNPAFTALTGYEIEEIVGLSPRLLRSGEHKKPFYTDMWATILAGRVWHGEVVNRRKDGRHFTEEMTITPVTDEEGEVSHFIAVKEDITESKAVELALRESEERFRSLYENSTIGLYRTTPDGQIVLANPALVRMLGYDSFRDLAALDLESGDTYTDRSRSEFKLALESTGEVRGLEATWRHKNGSEIHIRESARAIRDASGKTLYYEGTVEDVTERRKAEQSLRDSEERYRDIVEKAGVVIVVDDEAGNLTYCNTLFAELFGYAEDQIRTMSIQQLIHPEDRQRVMAFHRAHMGAGDAPWRYRFRGVHKDGQTIHLEVDASPVFRDGKPAGTRSFLRDVSEEQLLQERLAQAQKMESVGRLAGGVAHDFNNIMQVILGHSDFALARVDDDSETRNHLREIRAAANRAAALTSRLLAFSRQEVIHARTLDLNELTSETLNMLRRIIPENIEISFSPSPDGLRVDADQGQLEQVIMNLLINARDSMPRGGRLTVSTASEVDSEGDRLARLVVSDTGCGMDEATRQKVFEPFFSTKERGRGTGLGLSIVFGIVHQHGGAIDVESNIGVGTTFTVTLPVALAVQPEESGIADEQPEGGMETILLAEDEPAVREVISGCLEGAGYVVFTASDGLEAVEVFQARLGDIDLALLDAVMPRMDGIEALEKMRALRPSLRALFSTGYSGTAFGHGQSIPDDVDVIRKPYTLDELLRRVRAILDDAREPGRANPVSCRLDGQLSTGHGLNSGNRETGGSPTGRVDLTRSQRVHP